MKEEILKKQSSKNTIFSGWEWGEILEWMKKETSREDYNTTIGSVGICEELQEVFNEKLFEKNTFKNTGKFYLICESSRGSRLYKKYIPQNVLPYFKEILPKANIDGIRLSYKMIKKSNY